MTVAAARTRPFWHRRIIRRGSAGTTRSIWRNPVAIAGIAIVVIWILVAIFAPLIARYNPLSQNAPELIGPSSKYWFGTDELGRDVYSRVVYGTRLSLPLALLLVSLSLIIGTTLGAISGYFRGVLDGVIMRICDLLFAFPSILLAMVVTAVLGPSIVHAMLALVFISWPWYARIVRGLVLSIGQSDYVTSRRLLGASARRALVTEVLPNIAGPVLVLATLDLGGAVLLLSSLSFLGLGAQPPTAEWGSMVSDGTQDFQNWWVSAFPGLAIFTVVLAFNTLGDTLRDYFDPQTGKARSE